MLLRVALSLLIAGQGLPAREAFAAPAKAEVQVRVSSPVAGNPTPITTIAGLPDYAAPEKGGAVVLQWSAPQAADGREVFSYVIRYSTYSASDYAGNVDAWWNSPNTRTATEVDLPPEWGRYAHAQPGASETVSLTGLKPGARYYFGVRARDRYFRLADYDEGLQAVVTQARSFATPEPWTPAKITTLVASAPVTRPATVNLAWTAPNFLNEQSVQGPGKIYYDGQYCIQYSTIVPPDVMNKPDQANNWDASSRIYVSTANVATGDAQAYTLTGLTQSATYYFHVFTRNEWQRWSALASSPAQAKPYNSIRPVEDLIATAHGSVEVSTGSYIALQWKNPSGEDYFKGVRICYSTQNYPSQPDSGTYVDLEPLTTGQVSGYQQLQLMPRTTYYYTIFAYDENGVYSNGVKTSACTVFDLVTPDGVANLAGAAHVARVNDESVYSVTLDWTTPPAVPAFKNADYQGVRIYVSTSTALPSQQQYLATVTGGNNVAQQFTHNDLKPYTTYYYSLFSFDAAGTVSTAPVTTSVAVDERFVAPNRPIVLTALAGAEQDPSVGCKIYLRWLSPSEPHVTGVTVVARTDRYPEDINDGTVWIERPVGPNNIYDHTAKQLELGVTYYISLYATTGYGTYSSSQRVAVLTRIGWADALAPFFPLGIQLTRPMNGAIRLQWQPVKHNMNFTKFANPEAPRLNELYGYEVCRSTYLFTDEWERRARIHTNTLEFEENVPAGIPYYYKVQAIDASGNRSDSYIVDLVGNVHILCSEGSSISLSQEISRKNMMLTLVQQPDDERGEIVKSLFWQPYEILESSSSLTLEKLASFSPSVVSDSTMKSGEISISYKVSGARGALTVPSLRAIPPAEIDQHVSIFYYNGAEWLKLGTWVDLEKNVIKAKAKFAGHYQLRRVSPATEFTFYGVMPKIVTPNGDGQNDRALFRYANPRANMIGIKIFDVNGALVKKIGDTNRSSDVHGDYLFWDGTDSDNAVVEPGVYIYQLEGEGKTINGTIVVAR